MSPKPWKSEAILRLGLSLFLCQFLGALVLAVANYFAGERRISVGIFCALAAASAAGCGAALFAIRKPWELECFTRQFLWLIFFLYLGLTFGAFATHYASMSHAHTVTRAVVAALSFQGAGLVLVHRFLREHGTNWRTGFGFAVQWLRALSYGGLAACAFLPVGMLLQMASARLIALFRLPMEAQPAVEALKSSTTWVDSAAIGVIAIGLAPVAEEMLFRGILYPAVKHLGFPRLAVVGTSVFFAVIHLNLATFLPLLILALVLIWLYETTDNLLAPIAAHMTFNALQFALFYLLPPALERFEWLRQMVNP